MSIWPGISSIKFNVFFYSLSLLQGISIAESSAPVRRPISTWLQGVGHEVCGFSSLHSSSGSGFSKSLWIPLSICWYVAFIHRTEWSVSCDQAFVSTRRKRWSTPLKYFICEPTSIWSWNWKTQRSSSSSIPRSARNPRRCVRYICRTWQWSRRGWVLSWQPSQRSEGIFAKIQCADLTLANCSTDGQIRDCFIASQRK